MALVEKPVFLNNQIGPSMTDLMGYARNAQGDTVIIAVEGKALEPFGLPVRSWLRGDKEQFDPVTEVRGSRTRRLDFLCRRLGLSVDNECSLRYQLLHRTVSAVLEAELHGAVAAVVVVHAFGPQTSGNLKDFELFLEALGVSGTATGKASGPVQLGARKNVETWFLWWVDPHRMPE
jgi:hypothetical protein